MLWLRPLDAVAARPLPGTESVQDLFWSPDSRWLSFTADGKIKKVALAGGAIQVISKTLYNRRFGMEIRRKGDGG
jgi:hypothetical protein